MPKILKFLVIFIALAGGFHSEMSQAMLTDEDQLTLVVKLVKTSHQEALQEMNSMSKHDIEIPLKDWEECPACIRMLNNSKEMTNWKTQQFKTHIRKLEETNIELAGKLNTLCTLESVAIEQRDLICQLSAQKRKLSTENLRKQSEDDIFNISCWHLLKLCCFKIMELF